MNISFVRWLVFLDTIIMFPFDKLNLINFDETLTVTGEDIPGLKFAIESKLITDDEPKKCFVDNCEGLMTLQKVRTSALKKAFVCRKCRKQINWSTGTIFDNSKLSILMVLKLIFCWCQNKSIKTTCQDLGLTKKTVHNHFVLLRMMCFNVINKKPIKIGGQGKIVEIDETMIYKRKYNRGRLTHHQRKQVWVFGGIDRESGLCFAEIVENRDEKTLLDLIHRHIYLGTTIYSDGWSSYRNLKLHGYHHETVNHSENFLNPCNQEVHTQNIERKWRSLKENIPKSSNGVNSSDHIIEFIYRSIYHNSIKPGSNFEITLKHLENNPFNCELFEIE